MSNNDLISREALKKKLQARHDNGNEDFDKGYNIGLGTAIDLIDSAPTVERPQGEWIIKGYEPFGKCNICGGICEINNFCGHCGVKMKYNTEK